MIRHLAILITAACTLAACAPVPRPFSKHPESNPLVDDRRVTSSVQVVPVSRYPGLADAIVRDLAGQDILATTHDAGARKVLVTGTVENGALVWRATTAEQAPLGSVTQALAPGRDIPSLAHEATPLIVGLLTAEGAASDIASRPHVAVRLVHGPKDLQLASLSMAMADALAGQGVAVSNETPVAAVDGDVRVSPSSGGQDILQIDWTVRDAKGASLGVVSQGSPVDHKLLAGSLAGLAHDIAMAGAPGIVNVLRQKLPSALGDQ
jgi:hypothetical protein